jgi:hypothetical protein
MMQHKTFYAPKIALFLAFYLLTLTCVMQGDRFFKGVGWLHDFSRSINFQSVEDVFDDSSHRFSNKISFPKLSNKYRNSDTSIFISAIFVGNSFSFRFKNNSLFFDSYFLKKVAFFSSSLRLHLKYCVLIC